jgi:hypothetical protein
LRSYVIEEQLKTDAFLKHYLSRVGKYFALGQDETTAGEGGENDLNLRLFKSVTHGEQKALYRALAKKCHPDRVRSAGIAMNFTQAHRYITDLNEAYEKGDLSEMWRVALRLERAARGLKDYAKWLELRLKRVENEIALYYRRYDKLKQSESYRLYKLGTFLRASGVDITTLAQQELDSGRFSNTPV